MSKAKNANKPMPNSNRKTIFVGIEGIGDCNQFLMLPGAFSHLGNDYRLVTTEGKFSDHSPFDLVLRAGPNDHDLIKPSDVLFHKVKGKLVYLERLSKVEQQSALYHAFDSYTDDIKFVDGFYNLGAHLIADTGRFVSDHALPDNIGGRSGYVIKPVGGARSIGIMQFPSTGTNIRLFIGRFTKLRSIMTNVSELVKLVSDFNGKINLGEANHPTEVLDFFKDPDTKFLLQNAAPNDVQEFRILKNGNNQLVVSERDHLKDSVNTFETTYGGLSDTDLEIKLGIHGCEDRTEILQGIEDFIRSSYFPMSHGSIDLWIDTSNSVMKWGIFEYQPQFNHAFISDYICSNFLKDSLEQMYNAD